MSGFLTEILCVRKDGKRILTYGEENDIKNLNSEDWWISEPVFIDNVRVFSSIIFMPARKKSAGILSYCKTFNEVRHENLSKICVQNL